MTVGRITRISISIIVVVGLGWLLWKAGAFSGDTAPAHVVPTAKAETKDLEETVLATGEVSPVDETEIRSEVSAQVMQVQVNSGQRVEKGQQLVQLDRRELESQVNEDQYQIAADELRAKQATKELDRDRELIGKGFIPQKEYDDADITRMLAENDLQVQRAKLETLRQQIIKTDIRAPHSGIVLKLEAREGQVIVGAGSVSSGTVLMRIADLTHLKVDTRLNEVDVVKVHVNGKVELTFDSVPDKIATGTVTFISPSADAGDSTSSGQGSQGRGGGSSGAGGSGTRGFETIVAMDETDERIRPGITAHVKITMAKSPHAVTVPLTAVFVEEKKNYAYLKKGATFNKIEVDPGISDGMVVEIRKGLSTGDEVALENPDEKSRPKKKRMSE